MPSEDFDKIKKVEEEPMKSYNVLNTLTAMVLAETINMLAKEPELIEKYGKFRAYTTVAIGQLQTNAPASILERAIENIKWAANSLESAGLSPEEQ